MIDPALCIVGFFLLAYAADQFVIGAARLAVLWQVSTVVVGAVIVGFGTSAPEMLVSAIASAQGELDLAIGNIEGSNVANLSLVLGAAALIAPISISSATLKREAPLSLASVVLFAILVQGGLSRVEGAVMAVALVVALLIIIVGSRGEDSDLSAEVDEFLEGEDEITRSKEIWRSLAGLAGTLAGAQAVVTGAQGIADTLDLSGGFVGLTLVAIGTSLPELVTAVAAARKNETDLIVGNLLGSNLFNSLAVGATAAFAGPGPVVDDTLTREAVLIMLAVVTLTWAFMMYSRAITKAHAGVLLAIYVLTVPLLA